jgi:hypothetical protein
MSAGTPPISTPTPLGEAAPSGALPAADLTCPRCGYDQSGLEQSLRSQCERGELDAWPLKSTCAECGREFDWRDVFSIARSGACFFETSRLTRFQAFSTTIRRMPRAQKLWKWVRMEWPFRPGRMLLVLLVAMAFWSVLVAVVCTSLGLGLRQWGLLIEPPRQRQSWVLTNPWTPIFPVVTGPRAFWIISPLPDVPAGFRSQANVLAWYGVSLCAALLSPLVLGAFPNRVRASPKLWTHLMRVWLYGMPRLAIIAILAVATPRLVSGILTLTEESLERLGLAISLGAYDFDRFLRLYHGQFITVAVLFFMWRWWACAFREYMRLPRGGYLAAAMLLLSLFLCWLIALQFTPVSLIMGWPW